VWGDVRCLVSAAVVATSLLAGCGGESDEAGDRCVTDDGTEDNPALVTVSSTEAGTLTIAGVLRRDGRFRQFRRLAEGTSTQVSKSFLDTWNQPTDRPGNEVWVTVFVPTDTAFAALDPEIRAALEKGRLHNLARYIWLGHHSLHRPYPSSEFVEGLQANWQPTGVGSWEKTGGPSGPVDVQLTLDPLTYGGCPILQTDLRTRNGYIHIIGGVVVPDQVRDAAG
jgi:Fasciclin domain